MFFFLTLLIGTAVTVFVAAALLRRAGPKKAPTSAFVAAGLGAILAHLSELRIGDYGGYGTWIDVRGERVYNGSLHLVDVAGVHLGHFLTIWIPVMMAFALWIAFRIKSETGSNQIA